MKAKVKYKNGGLITPNYQTLGNIKFDSNKGKQNPDGSFTVKDEITGKDFGVVRNPKTGAYDWYNPKKVAQSPTPKKSKYDLVTTDNNPSIGSKSIDRSTIEGKNKYLDLYGVLPEQENKTIYGNALSRRAYNTLRPSTYDGPSYEDFIKNKSRFRDTNEEQKQILNKLEDLAKSDAPSASKDYNKYWDQLASYRDRVGEDDPYSEDGWNMYLGLPQKNKTFSVSKYAPTKAKDKNVTYYNLPDDFKQDLYDTFKARDFKPFENGATKEFDLPNSLGQNASRGRVLGNFSTDMGEDANGKYISYYDKYDLSPKLPIVGKIPLDNIIGNPFEIYDRAYLKDYENKPSNKATGGYLENNQMKKKTQKRNYAAGGNINDQGKGIANLAGMALQAATYQSDLEGQAYKANIINGLSAGVSAGTAFGVPGMLIGAGVGVGSELLKEFTDKKSKSTYVSSASPGNFATGGAIIPPAAATKARRKARGAAFMNSRLGGGAAFIGAAGVAAGLAALASRGGQGTATSYNPRAAVTQQNMPGMSQQVPAEFQHMRQNMPQMSQYMPAQFQDMQQSMPTMSTQQPMLPTMAPWGTTQGYDPWTVVADPQASYASQQYAATGGPIVPTVSQFDWTTKAKYTESGADSSGRKILRRGMRDYSKGEAPHGGEITTMQYYLKNNGYYTGEADGIYGPKTEAAVKAYQKYFNSQAKEPMLYSKDGEKIEVIGKGGKKIKEDGVVGDQTRTALMYREKSQVPKAEEEYWKRAQPEYPVGERLVKPRATDQTPNNFPDSPMNYSGGLELLGLATLPFDFAAVGAASARTLAGAGSAAAKNLGANGTKMSLPEVIDFLGNTVPKGVGRVGGRSFGPKTPSAYGTRIGYATGGTMDEDANPNDADDRQLSNSAFQVKGSPGVTDGNYYPEYNANLDHNEVVKDKFVFSNKLKLAKGMSFADAAKKIESSTGKAQQILKQTPNDPYSSATIAYNERRSQALAGKQEQLATMMGLRNNQDNNRVAGGNLDGPGDRYVIYSQEDGTQVKYDPKEDKYYWYEKDGSDIIITRINDDKGLRKLFGTTPEAANSNNPTVNNPTVSAPAVNNPTVNNPTVAKPAGSAGGPRDRYVVWTDVDGTQVKYDPKEDKYYKNKGGSDIIMTKANADNLKELFGTTPEAANSNNPTVSARTVNNPTVSARTVAKPTDPPYDFINGKMSSPNYNTEGWVARNWMDITHPYDIGTGKRKPEITPDYYIGSKLEPGQAAIDLGRDGMFYDPYRKMFSVRNSKGEYVGVKPKPGEFDVKGDNVKDLKSGKTYNVAEHLRYMNSPRMEAAGPGGPKLITPSNILYNQEDPSTVADPTLGAFPYPRQNSTVPTDHPYPDNGGGKGGSGVKGGAKKPAGNPQATKSPLDFEDEYNQWMYDQMQASANAGNLPANRSGYVTPPVTSTAAPRAAPNIASALDFGKGAAPAPTTGDPITNQFTVGDGLQGVEVLSKFGQLIGGPEIAKPHYDNTNISKENFDPSNALYQSQRNFSTARNSLEGASINQNRSFTNNLYAQKLNQDSDIISKYNQMNQSAVTQQEQRQADQRRFNVGQTVYTQDYNARSRGAYKNAVDTAFTSLGNFGEGLNKKQQGYDVLNILKTSHPEVYANVMGLYNKEKKG